MKEKIIEILTDLRPEFDFTEEGVNFIEGGMLDSFDMVALVDSLETEFNVIIGATGILPENFCSLDAIERLVNKNKK